MIYFHFVQMNGITNTIREKGNITENVLQKASVLGNRGGTCLLTYLYDKNTFVLKKNVNLIN